MWFDVLEESAMLVRAVQKNAHLPTCAAERIFGHHLSAYVQKNIGSILFAELLPAEVRAWHICICVCLAHLR